MIRRNPLLQGHITEHRRLLLVVSTHASFVKHCNFKNSDIPQEFFRSLFSPVDSIAWRHG
jgi:hypothetical protein